VSNGPHELRLIRHSQGVRHVSQNELPEPKPDFMLKFWFVAIAASGIPGIIGGLTALVIVLTFVAVLRVTGL
jgi:hypothetical protein